MRRSTTVLVTLCLVLVACGSPQPEAPSVEGVRERLEDSIRYLADDRLGGRGTPSEGLDLAAEYLATELEAAGFEPAAGDSYLQTYTIRDFDPMAADVRVTIGGIQIPREELVLIPFAIDPERTPLRLNIVFAGWGVVAPERDRHDLEGLEIEDTAVLTLLGAPWELDPAAVFGYDRSVGKSIEATVRGADLLVYVTDALFSEDVQPDAEGAFFREMKLVRFAFLPEQEGRPTGGLGPILVLSADAFDRTLAQSAGGTYVELQRRLSAGEKLAKPLGVPMELTIDAEVGQGRAGNVAAKLSPSEPTGSDEWVVLTAHYDGLGMHEVPEGEDGIWNGADDNASGTAVILEIARRLGRLESRERGVLVLLVSGEERGLLGSAYHAEHSLVPIDRVAIDVNVDMVGRSTGSVQALAHGFEPLFQRIVQIGDSLSIKVLPDQQPSWRLLYLTDHYHFARFGVPAVHFFTGLHADYHQPSDEADAIRYEELGRILDVMYRLTEEYVEGADKPAFDRPEWFVTP